MKLLLDIGNSRIKWAFADAGGLHGAAAVAHAQDLPAALAAVVAALPATLEREAAAVCVADARLLEQLRARLEAERGVALRRITTVPQAAGVTNGYEDFGQLGADRWAAIVGGWHQVRGPVVVVDAGTAMTIDLVAAEGRHLGGLIVPGHRLMATALGRGTADIARFAAGGAGPDGSAWFGRSTAEAVNRGAQFALLAAVRQAVAQFPADQVPRLLVTGGDAPALLDELPDAEHRPLLVLEGLQRLEVTG